jgi:hypothetical protein
LRKIWHAAVSEFSKVLGGMPATALVALVILAAFALLPLLPWSESAKDNAVVTRAWVRLPSAWIDKRELAHLSWEHGGAGADNIAALMVLTALAHAADQESGATRCTYDDSCQVTDLSRAKIANGLAIPRRISVVEPGPNAARSVYHLANFAPDRHWAMLPAKSMYSSAGRVAAYDEFQLRGK